MQAIKVSYRASREGRPDDRCLFVDGMVWKKDTARRVALDKSKCVALSKIKGGTGCAFLQFLLGIAFENAEGEYGRAAAFEPALSIVKESGAAA